MDEAQKIRLARVGKDWAAIVKDEPLDVDQVGAAIYGFSSELGALRLFHKYRGAAALDKCRMGFSENVNSWYFVLDV